MVLHLLHQQYQHHYKQLLQKDTSISSSNPTSLRQLVSRLVTFAPKSKPFLAHPLSLIKLQAQALGIPHRLCYVNPDPSFEVSYRHWFNSFVDESKQHDDGIRSEDSTDPITQQYALKTSKDPQVYLATGDIEDVCNSFLGRAAESTSLSILSPLWNLDRRNMLKRTRAFGFKILITCVSLKQVSFYHAVIICCNN